MSNDLLKILKEFNVNIENIGEIDRKKYNDYEEILNLFLSDIDKEFIEKKDIIGGYRIILSQFMEGNSGIVAVDYFNSNMRINIGAFYKLTKLIYLSNFRYMTTDKTVDCYLISLKFCFTKFYFLFRGVEKF
jgi:hypothetical protein